MGAIRRFFKKLRCDKSGNATLLVALGIPALIGGAGYGVDLTQWYMWKRELQHSVDQAAYAGAWALAREESAGTYSTRALQEYTANLNVVADFATDPTITIVDYAGGTKNSVLVSASASRQLPFSSFLTGKAATIGAIAQASFAEGYDFNACLVSLTEEGTGTTIGGNATVKAQCGLAALSCEEDAIKIDGSATVETDVIVACGGISAPSANDDEVVQNVGTGVLKDIYKELTPPTDDTPQTYNCTGKGQATQASLNPGTYQGLVVSCTTVLASGIYVIDGGELDLTANYNVTGTGVMFVLRNGARMKLGGSGNDNKLTLTPPNAATFAGGPYADQADKLSDILVFEERDNNAESPGHIFNGNSKSLIEGLIYLPDGNLQVNGTAKVTAQCLQISAYTIDIRGNATLETLCPVNKTSNVGTSTPNVKMVA